MVHEVHACAARINQFVLNHLSIELGPGISGDAERSDITELCAALRQGRDLLSRINDSDLKTLLENEIEAAQRELCLSIED